MSDRPSSRDHWLARAHLQAGLEEVLRERDTARAERDQALRVGERLMESAMRLEALVVQRARDRDAAVAERDRLRALLREWLDDALPQLRQWSTNADGRTLPERTWAVLEGCDARL